MRQLGGEAVVKQLKAGEADVDDFVLASGLVYFGRAELAAMAEAGEMRVGYRSDKNTTECQIAP